MFDGIPGIQGTASKAENLDIDDKYWFDDMNSFTVGDEVPSFNKEEKKKDPNLSIRTGLKLDLSALSKP